MTASRCSVRFSSIAGTVLAVGALGLAAVATAGTAGAIRSSNDAFLPDLGSEGIPYDNAKTAISDAHHACQSLDAGADPVHLGTEILDRTELTTLQGRRVRRLRGGQLLPRVAPALQITPARR